MHLRTSFLYHPPSYFPPAPPHHLSLPLVNAPAPSHSLNIPFQRPLLYSLPPSRSPSSIKIKICWMAQSKACEGAAGAIAEATLAATRAAARAEAALLTSEMCQVMPQDSHSEQSLMPRFS